MHTALHALSPRDAPSPEDRAPADAAYPASWYTATVADHVRYPEINDDIVCDVAVVGGGFTGLSTALELAERGMDVALFEAEHVGWGASGRNGGQIVLGYVKWVKDIARAYGTEHARQLWNLSVEGHDLLKERIARHAIECDYRLGYAYAAVKRRHIPELRQELEQWQAFGYEDATWLDRDALRQWVDCDLNLGGVLDRGCGHLHPLNYARGLARAAVGAGARVFEQSPVTAIEAGPKVVLRVGRHRVTANFVALAGNALLPGLSPEIRQRVRPRITPVESYIVATEPLTDAQLRATLPGDIAVSDIRFVVNYYRLSSDRRMLFGGGLNWSGLPVPRLAERMRREMVRHFPSLAATKIDYCWGGLVDMTADRLPDLGRVTPNIYYGQGFSGNGVITTGIAGKVLAEAIAGQAGRFDVFESIGHHAFPGGRLLRHPIVVAGALWYKLRDLIH